MNYMVGKAGHLVFAVAGCAIMMTLSAATAGPGASVLASELHIVCISLLARYSKY